MFEKSQIVRLIDVVFLGPVLMYLSKEGQRSKRERQFLFWTGFATMTYNGYYFWKNHEVRGAEWFRV